MQWEHWSLQFASHALDAALQYSNTSSPAIQPPYYYSPKTKQYLFIEMPDWLISPQRSALLKTIGGKMALASGQPAATTYEFSQTNHRSFHQQSLIFNIAISEQKLVVCFLHPKY